MVSIVLRVVGALLALAGLALTVVGVWFATQLGGSGTATFTATPRTADPVVLRPDVLNRVDADVVVTATPSTGGRTWMALANPSDATAIIGSTTHLEVTGVSLDGWTLETVQRGSGDPARLTTAELWRNQDDGKGPLTMTVEQAEAPETLVIVAEQGTVDRVTLQVSNKTWFVEAVVAALIGLFLLIVGLVLVWPRRRRAAPVPPVPAAPPAAEETSRSARTEPAEPAGSDAEPPGTDAAGTAPATTEPTDPEPAEEATP